MRTLQLLLSFCSVNSVPLLRQNDSTRSRRSNAMMTPKKPDPVDVEVGQRIRIQRLQSGLSQTSLAEQLGVTFQQVQKYEKGVNRVGAGRLTKIAKVLDVPVSSFFGAHDTSSVEIGRTAGRE